jgi:hypothetical protein
LAREFTQVEREVKKPKNPRTQTLIDETMLMMRVVMNIEEVGDCWEWTGAVGNTGHPIIHLRQPIEGMPRKGCALVRRFVFMLNGGKLVDRKPLDCKCGNKLCVNPAHIKQSTTSKVAKRAAQNGAWKGEARARRISAAKRAKSKLNIELAREIRLSPESGPVLAARYGVDKSLVNNIKRGTIWRDYSTPFAGLGARA